MTELGKAFRDWVKGQSGPYNYKDADICAIAQFGYPGLLSSEIIRRFGDDVHNATVAQPWTFEALASRLEAL